MFTLNDVAQQPTLMTKQIEFDGHNEALIRPLVTDDMNKLSCFLAALGLQTRCFYDVPNDVRTYAQELCNAINRYDKLRLVLELVDSQEIIGLLEFSFALVTDDVARYEGYGIALRPEGVCRYGLCVRDDYHGQGCGSLLTRYAFEVARKFGRQRIILWGGVHSDNLAAIRHYQRHGFESVGEFIDIRGIRCFDMISHIDTHPLNALA